MGRPGKRLEDGLGPRGRQAREREGEMYRSLTNPPPSLRKKAEAIDKPVPTQPMDVYTEMRLRQPSSDSGLDN